MYASDDESCGKSHSNSVVTIPMSTLMMEDLQHLYDSATGSDLGDSDNYLHRLYDDHDDTDAYSMHGDSNHDFTVPTSLGDKNGKIDSTENKVDLQRRRFRGRCILCTPSTLALLAGIVHGVAGPGKFDVIINSPDGNYLLHAPSLTSF
jgi:hypothetical protein